VTEKALKAAIFKTTARKRAFKRLSAAEQEAAAAEVVGERGDSAAAFFDLLALRKTGRNRVTQVSVNAWVVEQSILVVAVRSDFSPSCHTTMQVVGVIEEAAATQGCLTAF
jgi:hypothetical protein